MKRKSTKLFTILFFTALTSLAFANGDGESCNSKGHKETSVDASIILDSKQSGSQLNNDTSVNNTTQKSNTSDLVKS